MQHQSRLYGASRRTKNCLGIIRLSTAQFSPTGYPGVTPGNWPVDAINDFARHAVFYNPATRPIWSLHTGALPSGVKIVCYESSFDYPVPAAVPNNTWLSEDLLYHKSFYDFLYGYELFLQQGNPQQADTGSVLSSYFSSAALGFGEPLWRLESGLTQPVGYGVSNQFLTPQGGPGSTGAYGFGYAQTNQAPGVQLLKDWNKATAVLAVGYTLTGPTSGLVGDAYTYSVTPAATVTDSITLSDSGGGGTFIPTSLTFSGTNAAETFTYTPGSAGIKSLSATSALGGVVTGSPFSLTAVSIGYVVNGPTAGFINNSITYTVTPAGATTDTITLSDSSGGGTFSPTSLTFAGTSAPLTFTYTPGSSGSKTLTLVSLNGGTIIGSPIALSVSLVNYTVRGPSVGCVGYAIAYAFTPTSTTTDTLTLSDGGAGGTFYPSSLVISNSSAVQSVNYVPGSNRTKTLTFASMEGGTITGSPITLSVTTVVAKPTKRWFPGLHPRIGSR